MLRQHWSGSIAIGRKTSTHHPYRRPFYQYPKVGKKDNKEADIVPIAVLMQEKATGNNATLFDHSFEANSRSYPPTVATRCLIARQSFSFAGGVSFPFNFSNGLLISGFSVLATGENLFETLALNLVIYHRDKPIPIQDDDEVRLLTKEKFEKQNHKV